VQGQVVVRSMVNSEAAERAVGIIQRLHCFDGHHHPRLHRGNNFNGETVYGFRVASEVQHVGLNGMAAREVGETVGVKGFSRRRRCEREPSTLDADRFPHHTLACRVIGYSIDR
jgi:hypothetical protein